MEKKTGFILFDSQPGDSKGLNAEILAVRDAVEAEEIAAGRVFDPKRFLPVTDDHMIFANWSYRPIV